MQAAILLSVLYLLARLTGLLQRAIIGGVLPAAATEAYVAAFRLPDIVNFLVAGGALSITFIPIFTALEQQGKKRQAWDFFGALSTLMGLVLLVLTVLGIVFARPLVLALAPGFAEPEKAQTLELTIQMTRIMLPAQVFFYWGGLVVAVLNAHKNFGASGWQGAIYNIVAIAVGFVVWKISSSDVGFAWGILVGALVGNFLMPLWAARREAAEVRLRFNLNFEWRQKSVGRFFRNALPRMLGVSLPVFDQVVVGLFASLLPLGALTYLDYGNRAMLAPLGIVAQAASVAAFPYLAANSASQDYRSFAEFLRNGLRRLMFLTLPVSTLLIVCAPAIIHLLYGYGRYADRPGALDQTAVAFAFYCVGLFAWAGQQLAARGFYALQDTATPTLIGSALTIFFFIPLCWLAAKSAGIAGLAMATSIGAAAHFTCILIALEAKLRQRRYNVRLGATRIAGTLLGTGLACVALAGGGFIGGSLFAAFAPDSKLGDLLKILGTTLFALPAFALAAQALGVPEWKWLRGKVLR